MYVTTEDFTHVGFKVCITYLVLKSTCFLKRVLRPGEPLHVLSAVLTRLQVRLNDTLSDAVCENK